MFICGGAFVGLDKIIGKRLDSAGLGFGGNVQSKKDLEESEILKKCEPEDLIKFGLIPEFIGRIPISVSLHALDEKALVKILTEPKNALIKQYEKLLNIDNIDLVFDKSAVDFIASKAIKLKTGARGLRSIAEDIMLPIMYETPNVPAVRKIVIKEIEGKVVPEFISKDGTILDQETIKRLQQEEQERQKKEQENLENNTEEKQNASKKFKIC